MSLLISYLNFIAKSTNHHGVHSPFVYNLVSKCFYDKSNHPEYLTLNNYRKTLLKNSNVISVTDFGAGSRVFKSNQRKISAIAKNAGITPKRAKLLKRVVSYFQPNSVLEIGTSLGLATSAIYLGNPKAKITTLEGCSNTMNHAIENFKINKLGTQNIEFINSEFSNYLDSIHNTQYDLIYFDGNHSKDATLLYFNKLLKTTHNDSVWIFDDIHWSESMQQAWQIIKNHPEVTVTIDTFQWGFVFFRKEQEKEHFSIRTRKFYL